MIRLKQLLNESMIQIFSYAKPLKGNGSKLRKEADDYIRFLQSKRYTATTNSNALYFPDFTWAGGKQNFGECIGVLVGSDTIIITPIGQNKEMKFGESLLARFVKDGRIEAQLIKQI